MSRPRGASAATRARRLLALLHLLEHDTSYSIASIAEMLGTTEAEITTDLDALSCCGVAPYYPDQLMPLFVEDGLVEVFGPLPALEQGVRLSIAEARALAATLQTAGRSADDPLTARLLAAAAPGDIDPGELERVVRAAAAHGGGAALATVAAGLHERRAVAIAYRSAGSETETERVIEPVALTAERGTWYTAAYCRRAGALRTFRVDRIRDAHLLDEAFEPRQLVASGGAFTPGELPVARIRFLAGEEFSERDWPGARIVLRHDDGSFEADVPFAGTAWIARRVVARLGKAQVLAPQEVRAAVRAVAIEAAARDKSAHGSTKSTGSA